MASPTYSQANGDVLPEHQPDPFSGIPLIDLAVPSSSSPPSPLSTEESATIKENRHFTGAKSAIKRKGGIEPWNPSHKRSKMSSTDFPQPTSHIEDIKRELNAAKDQAKVLEKKIYALEIKIQILAERMSTRGERTGNRVVTAVNAQDHVKVLERKVKSAELAFAIIANVVELSNLPLEGGGE
ncbi:hypothetical protein MMC13_008501 [Lambiella insularis]|nr:hypothetical protein [Lambiella insularis]